MTDKSFTAEELREKAHGYSLRGDSRTAAMLNAYADMLERPVYSANPHTLADSFTLPDAERVHIGQQVAARVDAMMDRPADSGRVGDGRATFEAWVSKRHGAPLGRWADSGKYQYDNTNAWWECWQAALAAQAVTEPADSGRVGDDERQWRELLAIRVAGPMLYTDDGELSDSSVSPHIDFLRDSADTIASKLADRARAAFAAWGQGDDQTWDENAERLTREAGIGGGRINPNATSMDDIFLPTSEPASPAGVPHQVRFAIERCLRSQEKIADRIEKANPGDPYAALMIREDIEVIGQYLSTLSSEVGHCQCAACMVTHASDCAVHNMPAMPNGPCDCGAASPARVPDGWRETFAALLEDYAGARGEVAAWNVTQRVQPEGGIRMPRSRLAKLMAHVDLLAAAPSAPEGDGGAK